MTINFEQDRVESVTQIDAAKTLSDKVLKLKDLEDEILNAEESLNKLKEQARILSQIEIPAMMQEMHITKLKLKDGESVEVLTFCLSYKDVPAKYKSATVKTKAKITACGAFCCESTRKVATTKIHASENGINTFQPNFMNWS